MALHPSGPDHTPPPYLNKSARFREHVENRYQIDDRQDELQAAFQELSQLRAVEGTDDNLAQQLDKSIISFLTRTEILKSETDRFKPDFAEVEKLLKIKRPVEEPGDKGKADGQPPRVCASALVDVLMFFFSRTLDPVHFKTSQSFDLSLLYDNYHVKSDEGGLKKMDFQTFKFAQRTEALPQTVIAILYCFLLNHHRLEDGLRANEPDTRLKEDRMWAFNKASNINQLQFHNILIEDVLHGLSGLPLVGSLAKLDIDTKIEGDITGSYRREDSARLIYRLLSIQVDDPKASDDAQASTSSKSSNGPQTSSSSKSSSSPQASGSSKPLNGPQAPVDNQVADTPSNEARHILRESLQQPMKGCAPIAGAPSTILTWSRNCPLPTFNDYRRSLGLNSISSFSTWTDIREVEELASKLYMNNMEKLELLPGLLFERRFSGSGFGLGYTHTYALLADIVKTLRQDPIRAKLAKDELTPWGFEEAKPFPRKNAYEGQLCRLLLINIPTLSTATNAYTHFPLSSIANTKDRLDQLKLTEKYDMFFPSDETPYELKTLPLIAHVFNSPLEFNTLYGSELKRLTKGYGFMLGFDDDPKPDEDKPTHDLDVYMTCYALMPDVRAYKEYATYLQAQVVKHLKKVVDDRETYKEVDIAKHVIIPACTQWAREKIYGIPDEKLTDEQLEKHFEEFLNIFSVVFNKVPAAQQHTASAKALETSSELFKVIEKKLKERADKLKKNEENPIEFIMRVAKEYYTGRHLPPSNKHSFLDQLIQSNHSSVGRFPLVTTFDSMKDFLTDANGQPKENGRKELEQARLASNTMALAVVAAVNYAQACINILEYILQYHPNRLEELRKLAEKGGKESNEQIMAHCHEALRLHQPLFLYRRAAKEVTLEVPGKGNVVIKKGTVVYANLWSVHQALGESVKLDRGLEGEVHSLYGVGYHRCPAANFVKKTMPEVYYSRFENSTEVLIQPVLTTNIQVKSSTVGPLQEKGTPYRGET
ncbi:hypothetical protein BDN72DRAFT_264882 [Pluteus cervinus]|uniref:Uncharacterized protein n=1 Tax=Pluteus cervinus TaxID=181527 RepID=A0ACD3AGC4_9AGAR|nr:hypothetical protein BDN72DRAFT_264882 [Pluteus cervinus]